MPKFTCEEGGGLENEDTRQAGTACSHPKSELWELPLQGGWVGEAREICVFFVRLSL